MSYIIQNKNNYYVKLSDTNAIKKTQNINEATVFETAEAANKIISHASKKLQDYTVVSVDEMQQQTDCSCRKIKRRQFKAKERIMVYNNAKGMCEICGKFVTMDSFTVDHIIPISKGGTYDIDNLQLAHQSCNLMKVDALPDDFVDKMIRILKYQSGKDKKVRKKIKKKLK